MNETVLAKGKTKEIIRTGEKRMGLEMGIMNAFNDTTGGDGARHEIIEGKAAISTEMTTNTFGLLKQCDFPVAFERRRSETKLDVPILTMMPLEVVARALAPLKSSYLQRHPKVKAGQRFDKPIVEFFLKTKDKQWGRHELVCDDPLMIIRAGAVELYDAHAPFISGNYFARISAHEAFPVQEAAALVSAIEQITFATFVTLRYAWKLVGEKRGLVIELADFKVEYGLNSLSDLMLGDVIDGDSCRILVNGENKDKQPFRDGKSVEFVRQALAESCELSSHFNDHDIVEKVSKWVEGHFTFPRAIIPAPRLTKGLEVWD